MSAFLPPLFYGTFDLGKINYTKYYIIPSYHYSWARSHVFRSCAIKTDFFCILRVQHVTIAVVGLHASLPQRGPESRECVLLLSSVILVWYLTGPENRIDRYNDNYY